MSKRTFEDMMEWTPQKSIQRRIRPEYNQSPYPLSWPEPTHDLTTKNIPSRKRHRETDEEAENPFKRARTMSWQTPSSEPIRYTKINSLLAYLHYANIHSGRGVFGRRTREEYDLLSGS